MLRTPTDLNPRRGAREHDVTNLSKALRSGTAKVARACQKSDTTG